MPAYDYEIINTATGAVLSRLTLPMPVTERDAITVRRHAVPETIGVAGAARDPSLPGNQVLAAYKRIEQRVGNNAEFRRRIGHSPETVKRAWSA
jgi:hypothetical protein